MLETLLQLYGLTCVVRLAVTLQGPSSINVSVENVLAFKLVITLEQSNQRIRTRSAIEPKSDRVICRIISGFEEPLLIISQTIAPYSFLSAVPKEGVHIGSQIDITRIRVDTFGRLANTSLSRLLVADCDIGRSLA